MVLLSCGPVLRLLPTVSSSNPFHYRCSLARRDRALPTLSTSTFLPIRVVPILCVSFL